MSKFLTSSAAHRNGQFTPQRTAPEVFASRRQGYEYACVSVEAVRSLMAEPKYPDAYLSEDTDTAVVRELFKASVPLWVAVIEALRPRGEKPTWLIAGGLLLGALGVTLLVIPNLAPGGTGGAAVGTWVLLASALLFAIGTLDVRYRPPSPDTVNNVAWTMVRGGIYLWVIGLATGEAVQVSPEDFTAPVFFSFFFLLVVHSLAAFSAMNWLLRHLPAAVVTTKFYVSPAIAAVAGWLVLGEIVGTGAMVGLALILGGVTVVMLGEKLRRMEPALRADDADELEE